MYAYAFIHLQAHTYAHIHACIASLPFPEAHTYSIPILTHTYIHV
jgi:hypothetical protein